jgi:anti-sigma-K factor RskA
LKSASAWDAEHDREKAKCGPYAAAFPLRLCCEFRMREAVMTDEEKDALAAEYVLGTLAPDERANADGQIASDPAFAELVRQWERRLGELNVMVEAVEPPPQVWDRIKSGLGTGLSAGLGSGLSTPSPMDNLQLPPLMPSAAQLTPIPAAHAETEQPVEDVEEIGAPAASLLPPDEPEPPPPEPEIEPEIKTTAPVTPPSVTPRAAPSADVIDLAERARRWRGLAVLAGSIAAVLAALIVVSQVKPGLLPVGGSHVAQGPAPAQPAAAAPGTRLVGVLQQDPAAPAFLLTIDPASRTLTVRRVSARADSDHSYQLWLIAPNAAKPESLGVVGASEYTQSPLPAAFDAAALQAATYAISFEPPGGSKTGAPTGPILFTGRLVDSSPPAGSKT